MLRRLLLGQRKRQDNEDNEENKEVILITQNKEEEKCESDEDSETETEDSDNDGNSNSDTIEGSSVCSLDESFDNDDDTTQESKGFKMADRHDPARDELQLLGDSGNSDNKVQEKERRETEEATKVHETASDNGEVGEAKVSEEGHDDTISQKDRDTPPDNKKTIPNNINDDKNKNNKNSSSNNDVCISNNNNNNNDNNDDDNDNNSSSSNNNESNSNRRISRGQSFVVKCKASEKRPKRIPKTQSFPSENEIPRKSCQQVSCLQQPVQQQDQVRDARGRVGSKGFRGESLVKKSQPRDVERNKPVLKGNVRNIKGTEKRRMEMKSRKSSDSYETDSSVSKLVRILGIDIGELKDFIKNVKTEQGGKQDKQDHEGPVMDHSTTVPRKRLASRKPSGIGGGNNGSSEDVKLGLSKDLEDILKGVRKTKVVKGDQVIEIRKSPDGCHSVVTENEGRMERTQEETSSDSGVSETNGQRYMYINDVIKRKEHLTEEIAELDARILVMEGHRKDLQVVHDLFDLCSDELKDVERNNAGAPCVQSLKEILKRQIRELADSELKRKMNGLESIGVPYFTAIQEHIEKLRVEINDSLQDDRKCRSKSLQKMRFEYGKVLGMCEGILACVYQQ